MAVHEAQLSVQWGRRTSRSGLSAWRGEGGSPAPPPPPPAAPLPPPTIGNLNESADAAAMFQLQPCDVTSAHWSYRSALPLTTFCASSLQLRYLDTMREVKSTSTILRAYTYGKIINYLQKRCRQNVVPVVQGHTWSVFQQVAAAHAGRRSDEINNSTVTRVCVRGSFHVATERRRIS
jgi:hypothetical protein